MTRFAPFKQIVLGFVCLGAASSLVAEEISPEPAAATARNSYFEVVADDTLSAQYVAAVGEMLAKRFAKMLPVPGRVSQPVLVTLVPVTEFRGEGFFGTRIYPSGLVHVTISWGKSTSRATVERALSQAHLTYLSGAYSKGAVTVPLWLELALQHLARAQAVPAHARSLAGLIQKNETMRLKEILAAGREEGNEDELVPQAYWFLIFLEREGRSGGKLQHFLIRVLRGEAPLGALNAVFGEHLRSGAEAEMWWLVGVNELARSPGSPMLPASESRRRVMELARLHFRLEEGETSLFPEDLWTHRASANLQDELRRRIQMARMDAASVHSYYHNVLLALERVFQTVLAADEEAHREALAGWRHDLRAGDELAEDTASILDDLAAELAL